MRDYEDESVKREMAYTLLRKYEKPYRMSRFGGVLRSELCEPNLEVWASEHAAFSWLRVPRERAVKDFTGEPRAILQPHDYLVTRCGLLNETFGWSDLRAWLGSLKPRCATLWVWIWQEDRYLQAQLLDEGFRCAALHISAASEYRALYVKGEGRLFALHPTESLSLVRLNLPRRRLNIATLSEQIHAQVPDYAAHYSSYNKRQSWSAVALRGFGGHVMSIEKPAEMSRAWKNEHNERMSWTCEDTELRGKLPAVEPILDALGGPPFERIRLMKLSKGHGELSRHADITDKDSGTRDGKLMRLHVPIVTNPGVRFTSWDFHGVEHETHFQAGEAFYLDTRKAHKAVNEGENDRIHLVVDCVANAVRRALISQTDCL